MSELVDIKDLKVRFPSDDGCIDAVKGVSLEIDEGEIVALVGESGSGKTVTSKSILKMLPESSAVAGEVFVFSERDHSLVDMNSISEHKVRTLRGVSASMVFQEPSTALNPVYKIGWQLVEGLRAHSPLGEQLSNKDVRKKAIEILTKVGIPDPEIRVDYYPHQFSGGQKQRIVIAQALILGAKLIIADEPTTALDVSVQAEILQILKDIRKEFNTSILLITHNMGVVADMADRVIVMNEGKVVEENDVFTLFESPKEDYTKLLLSAVPKIDTKTRRSTTRTGAADENKTLVSVKDLTVEFKTSFNKPSFKAVDGIDFEIKKGEVLGLVGESGSGKSTTAKAVMNLVKSSGTLELYGNDVRSFTKKQTKAIMRKIGYIFQDPYASFNPLQTLGEAIAEPMIVAGSKHESGFGVKNYKDAVPRVSELLELVKLPSSYINRFPYELSGGQRQRIGFARALALEPEIIIADEPTSALDVSVQAEVLKLFLELQERLQFSSLFITHDLAVVDMVSDRIAVMQKGKIVEIGTGEQILTNPQSDYTKNLLQSLPYPDPKIQRKLK
jgi:peptide/nickel transport system ATP-binding protein